MTKVWQAFLDTIDGRLSVNDGLFWFTDLKAMMALPLIPFFVILPLANPSANVVKAALVAIIVIEVWWTAFLLHRRAVKKRNWVEPTRFSDENNGY